MVCAAAGMHLHSRSEGAAGLERDGTDSCWLGALASNALPPPPPAAAHRHTAAAIVPRHPHHVARHPAPCCAPLTHSRASAMPAASGPTPSRRSVT